MSGIDIQIVAAGLFFAGLVKGLTGIGYSTCALPFLVVGVGLKPAVAIVTLPAMASNLALMLRLGGLGRITRRFWPFYLASLPGIPLGVALLVVVDAGLAAQALGLVTAAYVGLALGRPRMALPDGAERWLSAPAGLANGVLTGLTGSQILPLMPFMMSLRLSPDDQTQAINIAVTVASAALAAALLASGLMTAELALASALGIVPAVAGVALGTRARSLLPAGQLRLATLVTLLMISISLVGRSPVSRPAATSPSSLSSPSPRPAATTGDATLIRLRSPSNGRLLS